MLLSTVTGRNKNLTGDDLEAGHDVSTIEKGNTKDKSKGANKVENVIIIDKVTKDGNYA